MSFVEYKAAPPYSPGVPVMAYQQPQQQPLQMQQTGGMMPMMAAPQQPMMMMQQPNMMMGGGMMMGQHNMCINGHSWKTEYGVCGIITAVVLFPVGLLAMLCDKKEVCRTCGKTS